MEENQEKNSKGVIINQIQVLEAKWTAIIVSIYLSIPFQLSYVKQEMLEVIKRIPYDRKKYHWASHVIGLLK